MFTLYLKAKITDFIKPNSWYVNVNKTVTRVKNIDESTVYLLMITTGILYRYKYCTALISAR